MKRIVLLASLSLLAAGLAGCQSMSGGKRMHAASATPSGIEGSWVDPNGIVSTFSNGRFETHTTDTHSVLATGTYTYTNRDVVQIALHSRLRNTNSTVNCALAGASRLNCTSDSGQRFSLTRAGAEG